MMDQSAYILALHHIRGLGPVRLKLLLEYFSDPKIAWEASRTQWEEIKAPPTVIESWQQLKTSLNIEQLLEQLDKSGIQFLSLFDDGYPIPLKQIQNPPVVLFFKGDTL